MESPITVSITISSNRNKEKKRGGEAAGTPHILLSRTPQAGDIHT